MDGVMVALGNRGVMVEAVRQRWERYELAPAKIVTPQLLQFSPVAVQRVATVKGKITNEGSASATIGLKA